MTMRRHLPALVCGAGLTFMGAAAQEPPPGDDELLRATLEAEIAALSSLTWLRSGSVSVSTGWRDNVLLSAFDPVGRGFSRGELEASLLRPRRHRWESVTFLHGDVLRYLSPPPGTHGEQQWTLHSELRWDPVPPVRLALKAAGFWHDTVVDLSETEVARLVTPTRVRGGQLALAPRVSLPAGFQFEPSVQARRTGYRDYGGDFDETRTGGRLAWQRPERLALAVGWSELHRRYDTRTNYTAGGRPLPGTHLRFRQRAAEFAARATWGQGRRWSLAATLDRIENEDRAAGYFDYTQRHAALELAWREDPWRAVLWGEAGRTKYRAQTVGAGIAPPARLAEDYEGVGRLERRLGARWTLFLEQRWERSRSNLPGFGYRVNTAQAGLRRDL